MLELRITDLRVEDAASESLAETRDRLKGLFAPGATRRMTHLGIVLGSALRPLAPSANDTVVYASTHAETRALEGYLDSFPNPSPTLFQTSIHPSAVQQTFIQLQQPVREFLPMTGGENLSAQALLAALLADSPRVILCGGEERGTWLLENGCASDRAFAFALALSSSPEGALARVTLDFADVGQPSVSSGSPANAADIRFALPDFFEVLHARRAFDGWIAPSVRLTLSWS